MSPCGVPLLRLHLEGKDNGQRRHSTKRASGRRAAFSRSTCLSWSVLTQMYSRRPGGGSPKTTVCWGRKMLLNVLISWWDGLVYGGIIDCSLNPTHQSNAKAACSTESDIRRWLSKQFKKCKVQKQIACAVHSNINFMEVHPCFSHKIPLLWHISDSSHLPTAHYVLHNAVRFWQGDIFQWSESCNRVGQQLWKPQFPLPWYASRPPAYIRADTCQLQGEVNFQNYKTQATNATRPRWAALPTDNVWAATCVAWWTGMYTITIKHPESKDAGSVCVCGCVCGGGGPLNIQIFPCEQEGRISQHGFWEVGWGRGRKVGQWGVKYPAVHIAAVSLQNDDICHDYTSVLLPGVWQSIYKVHDLHTSTFFSNSCFSFILNPDPGTNCYFRYSM